ncbi:MAG TPA: hypothetical protein DEA32_03100 [Firmicutes bacterium]|nr:hypothetical protein [Bacillota bacterium]
MRIQRLALLTIALGLLIGCAPTEQTSSSSSEPQSSQPQNSSSQLQSSSSHKDVDSITVFSINDLHGKIGGDDGNHSLTDLAGTIESNPYYDADTSIIVSAGDLWQGSYASGYDKGFTTTELMGTLGLKVMALGNHEFDWGIETIEKNMAAASFTFLCANLVDATTKKEADWIDGATTVTVGDRTIGFVGVMGPDLESSIKSGMLENYEFTDDTSVVDAAYDAIDADVTFLIAHESADSDYLRTLVAERDYAGVFCGHSHQFQDEVIDGIPALQGGSDNRGYSYMVLDTSDGTVTKADTAYTETKPTSNQALIKQLEDYLKSLPQESFGKLEGYWNKEKTANFVLTAMIYMVKVIYPDMDTSKLVAVHNKGGIRSSYPSSSTPTDFTMEVIQKVSPFDNKLMLLKDRTPDSSLNSHYYSDHSALNRSSIDIVTIDYLVNDDYSPMFTPTGAITIKNPKTGDDYILYDAIATYVEHLDQQGITVRADDYSNVPSVDKII